MAATPTNEHRQRLPALASGFRATAVNWIVVGLALAILGSLIFLDLRLEHAKATQREHDRLSTQARVIATDTTNQLHTADRVLEQLRTEYVAHPDTFLTAAHGQYLDALIAALPGIRSIGVIDPRGRLILSSNKSYVGRDVSGREYFRAVRQFPDKDRLYLSAPFMSLSGVYLLTLSKMIVNPDGSFGGVVIASLDPAYFRVLMQSVRYAPDMWDAIVHDSGRIFQLVPTQPGFEDKQLAVPGTFFTRHLASGQPATVMTGIAMTTGKPSMMAQQTLDPVELHMDHALVVAVSRDLDKVYANWQRERKVRIGLYLMVVLIAVSALFSYQRRRQRFEVSAAAAAAALLQSESNYRLIVENTNELIIKVDPQGRYTYVNPAFCALYDATPEQLLGRHYAEDVVEEDRAMVDEFFAKLFQPPHTVSFVHRENTAHGVRHLEWRGRALLDAEGRIEELIGIARDVTDNMQLMDKLQSQAHQDYLTGLANRRYFMDQGEAELLRARRYAKPLSLFMIDIDHFKRINDTYGHKTGDLVLQKLSDKLREVLRAIDIIGRIGGEEFAILLPETALPQACEVAERLRDGVARTSVMREAGMPVSFTISIGVASLQGQEMNLDVLLNLADQALYQAKQAGRNQVRASE